MREIDPHGDGLISREEFVTWMFQRAFAIEMLRLMEEKRPDAKDGEPGFVLIGRVRRVRCTPVQYSAVCVFYPCYTGFAHWLQQLCTFV